MKLNKPHNSNYCFTIVKVNKDIPLQGYDRIVHKNIFGNMVITTKGQYPEGTLMIYIPVETQLSEDYCYYNNLYDTIGTNKNKLLKGYISYKKRRIKAIKLGGFESNGMLMPLSSLSYLDNGYPDADFKEGDEFDTLLVDNKIECVLCNKYTPTTVQLKPNSKKIGNVKPIYNIVDNQFKFHIDTSQLGKNINNIYPDDIISITYKLHGTSGISSKILIQRKLKWYERLLLKLGIKIQLDYYDTNGIYASRKVIKSEIGHKTNDYYKDKTNWRKIAHDQIISLLSNGMTAYYEIVGFTPSGTAIQKGYDYGCEHNEMRIFVYRLTYTNNTGITFEFTAKQVQQWCIQNGLNAVPELYYGKAYSINNIDNSKDVIELTHWRERLLNDLKLYWYKQCILCKSQVPSEGIVIRKEGLGLEVYKYKNFDFLQYESKILDTNEINIEDELC